MSIRVNPNPTPDLLAALAEVQQQVDTATVELSTGLRINKPSDDPAGAAQLSEIHDRGSQNDSFQKSISSITGGFQSADSTRTRRIRGNFCFRAQRGLSPSLPIAPQHRGFDTTATPA